MVAAAIGGLQRRARLDAKRSKVLGGEHAAVLAHIVRDAARDLAGVEAVRAVARRPRSVPARSGLRTLSPRRFTVPSGL